VESLILVVIKILAAMIIELIKGMIGLRLRRKVTKVGGSKIISKGIERA